MATRAKGRARSDLPAAELAAQLGELQAMTTDDLRIEWRRRHRTTVPACFSRDLLLRELAYQRQQAACGGLRPDLRRQLASLARSSSGAETKPSPVAPRLKPGSTLVREWHGCSHTVLVLDQGFERQGRRYASLSEIAREITGAHWSGPRFFGLTRRSRSGDA